MNIHSHPHRPLNRRWPAALILGSLMAHSTFGAEGPATLGEPRGADAKGVDQTVRGEERAVLTFAPEVPPPITRKHATKVIVELEVKEVVKSLADGAVDNP